MRLPRRKILQLAAGSAAFSAMPRIVRAETYPARPVHIIVGFPPGAASDINARLIGDWLSGRLGQQFIVDNRPGAGSNVGTEAAAHAPADGYTLLLVTPPNAINASLYDNLNFNFLRDIAPVASIMRTPMVMEVNAALPIKTVAEFIAYAKANPGKLNFASSGNGTGSHVAAELFKFMTGVDIVHVPYRGPAQALTDLISGRVQVMFDVLTSSIGAYPRRRSARHRGDHGGALGGAAGRADGGRYGAGLRVRAAGPASARRQTRRPTSSPR